MYFLMFTAFVDIDGLGFANPMDPILLNASFFSLSLLFISFGGFYLYSGNLLKYPYKPFMVGNFYIFRWMWWSPWSIMLCYVKTRFLFLLYFQRNWWIFCIDGTIVPKWFSFEIVWLECCFGLELFISNLLVKSNLMSSVKGITNILVMLEISVDNVLWWGGTNIRKLGFDLSILITISFGDRKIGLFFYVFICCFVSLS